MQPYRFEEILDHLVAEDPRYEKDAYTFLREALDYTQAKIARAAQGNMRHIKGQELLDGIREYALKEFGPMTLTLFEEWGIHKTEDFGHLVFNLVDKQVLAKTEDDCLNDFKDGYDFEEAFHHPFLPPSHLENKSTLNPDQNFS